MSRRRSTPPRQRKGQKHGNPAPQIAPSVGPPSGTTAALEQSAQLRPASELDEIDAGWE
jgi:hypothetical protein